MLSRNGRQGNLANEVEKHLGDQVNHQLTSTSSSVPGSPNISQRYRYFDSPFMADMKITWTNCRSIHLHAHRAVLVAESSYFRRLFEHDSWLGREGVALHHIKTSGADQDAAYLFVYYFYVSKAEQLMEEVQTRGANLLTYLTLYRLAVEYKVPILQRLVDNAFIDLARRDWNTVSLEVIQKLYESDAGSNHSKVLREALIEAIEPHIGIMLRMDKFCGAISRFTVLAADLLGVVGEQ